MADSNPYRKKDRDYRLEKDRVDLNLDSLLAPAGAPIPDRVCGQCAHYIAGGYCRRTGTMDVGYLWTACHHFTTEKQTTMETPKTTPAKKVCKQCGRELPAEAFGRHARSGDGLQPYCKECRSKLEKGTTNTGDRRRTAPSLYQPPTPRRSGPSLKAGQPPTRPWKKSRTTIWRRNSGGAATM